MKELCFLIFIFLISSTSAKVCETNACKNLSKELKMIMDQNVNPCDDFSSYVCGNFDKVFSILPGESSFTSFSVISNEIINEIQQILDKQPLDNHALPQTKVATFYKSCLNITKRNIETNPTLIKFINQLTRDKDYVKNLNALLSSGLSNRMVSITPLQNPKDPQYKILQVGKPNLILPEGYLRTPETSETQKIIKSYVTFVEDVLRSIGIYNESKDFIDEIVKLHVRLAKAFPSLAEQKDPIKSLNLIRIPDLEKRCNKISWKSLINGVLKNSNKQMNDNETIALFSWDYIDVLCSVFQEFLTDDRKLNILKMDIRWAAISSLIYYGSEGLMDADYKLNKDVFGIQGKLELSKTCIDLTSNTFLDIIGNMYVKNSFPVSKRTDIEFMIKNVRKALKENIEQITWMDSETKCAALIKLNGIKYKIGYPDSILSEDKLLKDNENVSVHIDKFMENQINYLSFLYTKSMKTIGEKIKDDEWVIGSHQVNAYYNPFSNEIVFPAAILRYPYYDIDLPITVNYGSIGMVLGHEILHGFDTTGARFDEKGLLRNWWSKKSLEEYIGKAQCIIDQYGKYSVYNISLPSTQTITEDIADNAGVRMAYKAAYLPEEKREKLTLPGLDFTAEQLFFIAQARIWCSLFKKNTLLQLVKNDFHSYWKYRINGPQSNMPEFSKHFKCNRNQNMNRSKKCIVW